MATSPLLSSTLDRNPSSGDVLVSSILELPHEERRQLLASTSPRLHYLDALRGFAVLLGVALHAAIPWVPGYEQAGDALWDRAWPLLVHFIHGFRLPLFFMLSGFFTAMVARRRGLRSMVRGRAQRIGLPLLLSSLTVMPLGSAVLAFVRHAHAPPEGELLGTHLGLLHGLDVNLGHLWFLWHLLIFVAGFSAVALIARVIASPDQREHTPTLRMTMWALVVPTFLLMILMPEHEFGPAPDETLLPHPVVLAFYACFFAFGALLYLCDGLSPRRRVRLERQWPFLLGAATFLCFLPGLMMIDTSWPAAAVLSVAFAWLSIFGWIGCSSRMLSRESFWVRYLSDASYWIYLIHMTCIFAVQGVVASWPVSGALKFSAVMIGVTILSVGTYHGGVRYTPLGTLMNGRRTRAGDTRLRRGEAGQSVSRKERPTAPCSSRSAGF